MQRISLAPVLSATLSRDSCWITSTPVCHAGSRVPASLAELDTVLTVELGSSALVLLSLLEDLDDPPALGRRQRPGLHQQHPVTDAARVLLVVRVQLVGAADDLAVQGVLDPVLDRDHHGLVHLVADDVTLTGLPEAARGLAHSCLLVAHAVTSVLSTVVMPSS